MGDSNLPSYYPDTYYPPQEEENILDQLAAASQAVLPFPKILQAPYLYDVGYEYPSQGQYNNQQQYEDEFNFDYNAPSQSYNMYDNSTYHPPPQTHYNSGYSTNAATINYEPDQSYQLYNHQHQGNYYNENSDRTAAASALASSVMAVDNGKGVKVYKCPRPLCTKVYKNPNGLKYHLDRGACEVDHDVMEKSTGISLHTDDPNALFNLQQHAISSASQSTTSTAVTAALMASDESLKIVHRPYGCKVPGCSKRYQNLNGLKYHAKTAHPMLDFKDDVYVLFPF